MNKVSAASGSPRYYLELVGKTLDVIGVLGHHEGELRLSEIAEASHIDNATVFRILYTMEKRGYVLRNQQTKKFRLALGYHRYRVGYAQLCTEEPFVRAVTQGLIDEANKLQMDLLVVDNRADADQALKNAEWLIEQKVDFVIEYQIHYRVAPVLADMFAKACIPTLAIDIPQPHAVYFGADNYTAGRLGGEALGSFAHHKWRGQVDRLLLLEAPMAGRTPQSRIIGTIQGVRNLLPHLSTRCIMHRGVKETHTVEGGYRAATKVLQSLSPRTRLLIASVNDCCALGALRAVREAGHERRAAIMGQNFSPDPLIETEIRKNDSPLIGSVAYFPERYGSKIVPLALKWLNKEQIPPAVHTDHVLVTRENVDEFCAERDLASNRANGPSSVPDGPT